MQLSLRSWQVIFAVSIFASMTLLLATKHGQQLVSTSWYGGYVAGFIGVAPAIGIPFGIIVYDAKLRQSTLLARRWGYLALSLAGGSPMGFSIFLKHLGEESVEALGMFYGFAVSLFAFERIFSEVLDCAIFNGLYSIFLGSPVMISYLCFGFWAGWGFFFLSMGLLIVRNWFLVKPSTTDLSPVQPITPPTTPTSTAPPPLPLTISTTNPQTVTVITPPQRMAITMNPGRAADPSTAGSRAEETSAAGSSSGSR